MGEIANVCEVTVDTLIVLIMLDVVRILPDTSRAYAPGTRPIPTRLFDVSAWMVGALDTVE